MYTHNGQILLDTDHTALKGPGAATVHHPRCLASVRNNPLIRSPVARRALRNDRPRQALDVPNTRRPSAGAERFPNFTNFAFRRSAKSIHQ